MLSDLLSILRFFTDAETRGTIKAIAQTASQKQHDWRKSIHILRGKFNTSDWPKINAFTNELFQRVTETGISKSKYKRFTTVYSELIDNAYHHGCRGQRNCKITVKCLYSRWFIQLEIADSGKGFNLREAIEAADEKRLSDEKYGKSGLELSVELSDSLEVKRSRVIAVIAGEDRIKVNTEIGKLGNVELLSVIVEEDTDWSFLYPRWEPLRDVLDEAEQPLILIRFGRKVSHYQEKRKIVKGRFKESFLRTFSTNYEEATYLIHISGEIRRAKPFILECALDQNHCFAYVIPDSWVNDDLRFLETSNLRFFRNVNDACDWLKQRGNDVLRARHWEP